ncbi:hypothetical protein PCANC_04581 [Puccinia coronata f. sp. avenae]|uniref:Uncharacterized protein n=1 Tax=Puccinia coronata f. sp. avenae TaxID=200324 RepID=A0A2N5W0C3_9BASI|nr:hypothetical protein PCANC_04581 [Puccinia coronata f. sp. avenae]
MQLEKKDPDQNVRWLHFGLPLVYCKDDELSDDQDSELGDDQDSELGDDQDSESGDDESYLAPRHSEPSKTESSHRRQQIVLEYVIGDGHWARKWLRLDEPPLTEMKGF